MNLTASEQKSFLFDLNRCTGCGACMVACSIQNYGNQDLNWRNIYLYNKVHHPAIPSFSISMACNHCEVPACKNNCPANAYTKDSKTGAVTVDPDKCIGCKYCTWACPYDAPKYFKKKRVIQKCDFCLDRVNNNESPACIQACPTNALALGDLESIKEEQTADNNVTGLPETELSPAIHFKDLRNRNRVPLSTSPRKESVIKQFFKSSFIPIPKKIQLRSEWALLLFTTIASVLVGFMAAFSTSPGQINPYLFLGTGVFAMGLTTTHLGIKRKAYRALFNLSKSWLSREILFYSLFIAFSGVYLLFIPENRFLGYLAAGTGFISLYSIDRLYQVALKVSPVNFHSAHTLLNGIYLMGIISENLQIILVTGLLKLSLYLQRKIYFRKSKKDIHLFLSSMRILLGIIFPMTYFMIRFVHFDKAFWFILTIVIIGEFIDRIEYYKELDIMTPEKQIFNELKKLESEL